MPPTPPIPANEEPDRLAWKGALAVALTVAALVVWRACSPAPPAPQTFDDGSSPPDGTAEGSAETAASAAPLAPRCSPAHPEPFVIGDAPPKPRSPGEGQGGSAPDADDELAPFAVEAGRGTVYDGGFAVGAQREAEGGTVAMVATLAADGTHGRLVRLARSRGDMDPPVVAGAGSAVLTAMLEPNAGGRAIKVAKVELGPGAKGADRPLGAPDARPGAKGAERPPGAPDPQEALVTWGAELAEGRDESLALDLAASGDRAVLVWDDVTRDGTRSRVMLASFDVASLRSVTSPRPISQPSTDAESPRVIPRPGGYWLAYVARAEEPVHKRASQGEGEDDDTAAAGETLAHQWIEVAPLDETGTPTATPRPITPKDGHVLAYDLMLAEDAGVLVAFRDDDTPSGSSGGRVSAVLVGQGGAGEPRVLVGGAPGSERGADAGADDLAGAGVPALLNGATPWPHESGAPTHGSIGSTHAAGGAWLAIASASGATQLAALSARGELLDGLRNEAAVGRGEPIAALGDKLLVAQPAGKAMLLAVLRCTTSAPPSR